SPTMLRCLKQSATVRAGEVTRTITPASFASTTPAVRAAPDHQTRCSGGQGTLGFRVFRGMPSHTSEGFCVVISWICNAERRQTIPAGTSLVACTTPSERLNLLFD